MGEISLLSNSGLVQCQQILLTVLVVTGYDWS